MFKLIFAFIFVYFLLSLLKNSIKYFAQQKKRPNLRNHHRKHKNEKDISAQAEVLAERRLDKEDQ